MVSINHKNICIDTNVFIYYFQQHEIFGPPAKVIFELLEEGKVFGTTSIITLIELMSFDLSLKQLKDLRHDILQIPNLSIYDIDQEIGITAAKLRRIYGIRIPDAIQLATGICNDSEFFITNDSQLKGVKEIDILPLSTIEM